MDLTVDIQHNDIEEHYDAFWREIRTRRDELIIATSLLIILGCFRSFFGPFETSHYVLFCILLIVSGFADGRRESKLRSKVVNESNPTIGIHNVTFSDEGIIYSNQFSSGRILWDGVRGADETKNLFRFFIGAFEAVLIPKRFIENENEFRELVEEMRRKA